MVLFPSISTMGLISDSISRSPNSSTSPVSVHLNDGADQRPGYCDGTTRVIRFPSISTMGLISDSTDAYSFGKSVCQSPVSVHLNDGADQRLVNGADDEGGSF